MRDGWGDWLIGLTLAAWAASTPVALVVASAHAIPPFPWTFFAIYSGVAIVAAVGAAFFLRRGWILLHRTPPSA